MKEGLIPVTSCFLVSENSDIAPLNSSEFTLNSFKGTCLVVPLVPSTVIVLLFKNSFNLPSIASPLLIASLFSIPALTNILLPKICLASFLFELFKALVNSFNFSGLAIKTSISPCKIPACFSFSICPCKYVCNTGLIVFKVSAKSMIPVLGKTVTGLTNVSTGVS